MEELTKEEKDRLCDLLFSGHAEGSLSDGVYFKIVRRG